VAFLMGVRPGSGARGL